MAAVILQPEPLSLVNFSSNMASKRPNWSEQEWGKPLPDEATLSSLGLKNGSNLYLKDLGTQIGWKTVFLCEYAGPLVLYLIMYSRPKFFYGSVATTSIHRVVHLAAGCWSFHYVKRLLETLFVHRFSHNTMPISNLFKNCSYYWLFGMIIGYFVNHPLYTPPMYGNLQVYTGLGIFVIGELGNFSIHMLLRNLRPKGFSSYYHSNTISIAH
ncbi:Very-long-chain enoyl-CoA reductase [Nymphon striatum]|nr:Very-long-chain enoyl-CoA reductase [Nymphon striatum]